VTEAVLKKSTTGFNLDGEDLESSPLKSGAFNSSINAIQSLRLTKNNNPSDSKLNPIESMASIVHF